MRTTEAPDSASSFVANRPLSSVRSITRTPSRGPSVMSRLLLAVDRCSFGGRRQTGQPGPQLVDRGPPETESEVAVVDLEPVTRSDVGPVLGQQHLVKPGGVDGDVGAKPHEPDHAPARSDPFEGFAPAQPRTHH